MTYALSAQQLTKVYANGMTALKAIDLNVAKGDFFALLGPNGAGKSTTIGIICSLVKKTSGKVFIFGHDIDTESAKAKSLIGVVPQEANFSLFEKVSQILLNQAGYYGIPRKTAQKNMELYLKELNLWDKRDQPVFKLSGGMKRRLMIVRALMSEPKLLILDEPTAGVDIELRRTLWHFLEKLNQEGTTIILTTHYLEEAEQLCKHVAIIDHGRIIEHANMKTLISRLNMHTVILDIDKPQAKYLHLIEYQCQPIDDTSIEVIIRQGQSVNHLFHLLSQKNINVISMRNKTNRLEELFMHLIEKNKKSSAENP